MQKQRVLCDHHFMLCSNSIFFFAAASAKMSNWYLRTLSLDIIALQETHADTQQLEELFHTQFQAAQSVWSPHCGLVCFSSDLSFNNIQRSTCGRFITVMAVHSAALFDPIVVSVLYAPAGRRERYPFLSNLINSLSSSPLLPSTPSRHILLGDFNYIILLTFLLVSVVVTLHRLL